MIKNIRKERGMMMFKIKDKVIIKLTKRKATVTEIVENRFDKTISIVVELKDGPFKGETVRYKPEKLEAA